MPVPGVHEDETDGVHGLHTTRKQYQNEETTEYLLVHGAVKVGSDLWQYLSVRGIRGPEITGTDDCAGTPSMFALYHITVSQQVIETRCFHLVGSNEGRSLAVENVNTRGVLESHIIWKYNRSACRQAFARTHAWGRAGQHFEFVRFNTW